MQLFGNVDGGVMGAFVIWHATSIGREGCQFITQHVGNWRHVDNSLAAIGLDERMRKKLILDLVIVIIFEKHVKKHRVLNLVGIDHFKEWFIMAFWHIAVSILTTDDLAVRKSVFVAVLQILLNVSARGAKHIDVYWKSSGLATENQQEAGSTLERQRASLFDKHFQ